MTREGRARIATAVVAAGWAFAIVTLGREVGFLVAAEIIGAAALLVGVVLGLVWRAM